jgi:uncharacterized protein (TIGR01777 family)
MDVFLTGGTGLVGRRLARALINRGYRVTVLTRTPPQPGNLPGGVTFVVGDPSEPGEWQQRVVEHHTVINLAGASIFRRWTRKGKHTISNSRLLSTENLVGALAPRAKETVLLSASGVGYYGHRGDEILGENSPSGSTFLSHLAMGWEAAAHRASDHEVRVVLCRLGHVLARDGGVLRKLVPLFKLGLGSPWGSGRQWFSWIHEADLCNIFLFLMEHREISGPINCTSPEPVRNREMVQVLAEVLHRPTPLPTLPRFFLKSVLGEFSSVFVDGQRVLPKSLVSSGL